jgi:hypothetical protein
MDPKVLSKLLTYVHGGSKLDEDGFGDGLPLQQGARTGLQIGSPQNRNLRQWKKIMKKWYQVFLGIWNL